MTPAQRKALAAWIDSEAAGRMAAELSGDDYSAEDKAAAEVVYVAAWIDLAAALDAVTAETKAGGPRGAG